MGRTSIQVSDELADELHDMKDRGESYEDVIWGLIEDDTDPGPDVSTQTREDAHTTVGLENVEFPSTRDRDECEAAVRAARRYLEENGPASMRELVEHVMPAHPVGYDVPELEEGERYRGAWWRKVVKPGLDALEEVEAPPPAGSKWRIKQDTN